MASPLAQAKDVKSGAQTINQNMQPVTRSRSIAIQGVRSHANIELQSRHSSSASNCSRTSENSSGSSTNYSKQISFELSSLRNDLLEVLKGEESINLAQELKINLAQQKALKNNTQWHKRTFHCFGSQDYQNQKTKLVMLEHQIRNKMASIESISHRIEAEIQVLEKQQRKLQQAESHKEQHSQEYVKAVLEAKTVLENHRQREARTETRIDILGSFERVDIFSNYRNKILEQAQLDAIEEIKAINIKLIQAGVTIKKAAPSPLILRVHRAKVLKPLYDTSLIAIEGRLKIVRDQHALVKQKSPWYRPRPFIEKVELREIALCIQDIKKTKHSFMTAQKAITKEEIRLHKKHTHYLSVVEKLIETKQTPEPTSKWAKLRFDHKRQSLEKRKSQLEKDQLKKICFEPALKNSTKVSKENPEEVEFLRLNACVKNILAADSLINFTEKEQSNLPSNDEVKK